METSRLFESISDSSRLGIKLSKSQKQGFEKRLYEYFKNLRGKPG